MDKLPVFQYTPLPPNSSAQKIIRIIDLLPDQPSSVIKCNIQLVSLYQNPAYEALSYYWGNATVKLPILCNGAKLEITTSLYSALRRLRDRNHNRKIWADAICINQSPKAEEKKLSRFNSCDISTRARNK
jgi:hypothetical protein